MAPGMQLKMHKLMIVVHVIAPCQLKSENDFTLQVLLLQANTKFTHNFNKKRKIIKKYATVLLERKNENEKYQICTNNYDVLTTI